MISFATPIHAGATPLSPPSPTRMTTHESPTGTRSRRFAMLPPPPDPPSSPPLPARSPLRPMPRTPPVAPVAIVPDSALSKRKHALLELLTSERAYASDLALIRDIHMPLALGQPAPFLTSSASTITPPPVPQTPPMTREDAKIIFGNVEELAVFSEVFCAKLEEALAGILDPDGDGKDHVAELFLSMIPHMKPPYTTYITRHPSAVAHLNALPQTSGLTAYLAQTHTLAQSYTHAWDLPSLLIKPVQRLLKYPLLLAAIMDDTEPGKAKDMLREARDKVEEVARGVNEGRRRWDVVKTLLDGKHPPPVRLKSMKVLRHRTGSKDGQGQLEELEKRVHACEVFVQDFAKDIVDWSMSLRDFISQLERWSATFGRVIGLGQSSHGSEALDLFIDIVTSQISPIWISLDTAIQTTLLPKLARLLTTTAQPLLLLEHVHALRPQHIQLLETPVSKTRPPNSLVEASQSYLALEAQLRTELPKYIQILERGFTVCLGQFTEWQARFWKEIRAQWVELWDALSIEGDMTAGAADTVKVWWERWEEMDAAAGRLGITKPKRDRSSRASHASQTTGLGSGVGAAAALATAFVGGPAGPASTLSRSPTSPTSPTIPRPRRHSIQSIDLEIDTRLHGGSQGSGSFSPSPMHDGVVASPESYASFGVGSKRERKSRPVAGSPMEARSSLQHDGDGGRDKFPLARRESERLPLRRKDTARQKAAAARHQHRDGGRLPVVKVDSERALATGGGRPEISLPVTARLSAMRSTMSNLKGEEREWGVGVDGGGNGNSDLGLSSGSAAEKTRARISKKTSIDSTASRSSPRVSIHTHTSSESGTGTGSGSGSGVSNHRLSMQSMDVHIGMDVYASPPPPPPPPPPLSRAYENEPGASTNGYGSSPATPSSAASASPSSQNPKQTSSIPVLNTHVDEDLEARGRVLKKPSIRKRFADAFRSPSKRPTGAGAAPRVGAGGGTFTVLEHPTLSSPTSPSVSDPALLSPASASAPEYEQEFRHAYEHEAMQQQLPDRVLYTCAVIHPFVLPPSDGVLPLYRGLSFLAPLQVGDTIAVLSEEGHPRDHSGLPIQPAPEEEEREECLLLGRDEQGMVGWALASFLVILS